MEFSHLPVLPRECIDALNIKPDGIYVDGTLGGAGHSVEIAKRIGSGRLICIDRDMTAIETCKERLREFGDKVTFEYGNFGEISRILDGHNLKKIDGLLLDLGVSSPQLDDGSRGFSYMSDAPLDMRMDKGSALTAFDVVNTWTYEELKRILFRYGEERYAPLIAAAIVRKRDVKAIATTLELVGIIKDAMPAAAKREKQHPAKRSFQAIRIAVNDELTAVSEVISEIVPRLNGAGRIAVISFHSLEDRIVKNAFAEYSKGCVCPPKLPVCVCGVKPSLRLIGKRPVVPGDAELGRNPRARSAKLRIAERV